VFKLLLISIVIVPMLLGVTAANSRPDGKDRAVLRTRWILYASLWIGLLYVLRYRWAS
jgi:hypothetical protein